MSVTKAKRHGANAGGPQLGYNSLNDGSVKITPSSSRMRMKRLPFGKAAWATRTVSSGIGSTDIGRSDMDPSVHESFASTAPQRNSPTVSVPSGADQVAAVARRR